MEIKVGKKIKLLRKKNDVTQDKLAAHLGVTPQAVSRWESETCYPDIESLPAIADFFGVSMDELMCYDSLQKEQKVRQGRRLTMRLVVFFTRQKTLEVMIPSL